MPDLIASVCGAGVLVGFALVVVLAVIGIAYSILKGGKLRGGAATPLNVEGQYKDFLEVLDALKRKYRLEAIARPGSYKSLMLSCLGRKEFILLAGKAGGKNFTVSAVMGGNALLTKLEVEGSYALPIDVVSGSVFSLPGLGREMRFIASGPAVAKAEKFQVLPESPAMAEKTRKAVSGGFLKKMGKMILLKPKTMNISSQVTEFYQKKFTAFKDRAFLRDYGLMRDRKYALELAKKFLEASSEWEKAGRKEAGA